MPSKAGRGPSSFLDEEGPSLHDFMAPDASFFSQFQRTEAEDYVEYRVFSDRAKEGEESAW